MTSTGTDKAKRLAALLATDLLNPLLLLALALFSSLGYILSLLRPIGIEAWSALLAISLVAPLLPLLWRARRMWLAGEPTAGGIDWRLGLAALPLLLMTLPLSVAVLSDTDLSNSAHARIYLSYVHQLYHGLTPPENVTAPGFHANHYWLFHAWVAGTVRLTGLDMYRALHLLNYACMYSAALWLAQSMVRLGIGKPRTLRFGLALLAVFCAINLTGAVSWLVEFARSGFHDVGLPGMLLEGSDRRLHTIIKKIYNASGFTPGLAAFFATLALCLRMLREGVSRYALVIISAAGIVCLGLMPPLILFLVFAVLGGFVLTACLRGIGETVGRLTLEQLRAQIDSLGAGWLLLYLALSLALSLPLVGYGLEFIDNYRELNTFDLFSELNLRMVLTSQLLLLPIFVWHARVTLRWRRREDCFLLLTASLGFAQALGWVFADENQYKYHYLLSMLLALSGLRCLYGARKNAKWRRYAEVALAAFFALSIANGLLGVRYHMLDVTKKTGVARIYGVHIDLLAANDDRLPGYYWIRENTPADSIVIARRVELDRHGIVAERSLYARQWNVYHYAHNIDAHAQRLEELDSFFNASLGADEYGDLLASMREQLPGRPLYAVVLDGELSQAAMAGRGAELAYRNDEHGVGVWQLNP